LAVGTDTHNDVAEALASIHTEAGTNLLSLAEASPVLLIFLRHFGCSFCRQAISDVADLRSQFDALGVRPVFVHLGTPERAKPYFDYYHLENVERVSNPAGDLYRHPVFALGRVHPAWQLVTPAVWVGWLKGRNFQTRHRHYPGRRAPDARPLLPQGTNDRPPLSLQDHRRRARLPEAR
jgi:peroxiredoxin